MEESSRESNPFLKSQIRERLAFIANRLKFLRKDVKAWNHDDKLILTTEYHVILKFKLQFWLDLKINSISVFSASSKNCWILDRGFYFSWPVKSSIKVSISV